MRSKPVVNKGWVIKGGLGKLSCLHLFYIHVYRLFIQEIRFPFDDL